MLASQGIAVNALVILVPAWISVVLALTLIGLLRPGRSYWPVTRILALLAGARGVELSVVVLTATQSGPQAVVRVAQEPGVQLTWGVINLALLAWALWATVHVNRRWTQDHDGSARRDGDA